MQHGPDLETLSQQCARLSSAAPEPLEAFGIPGYAPRLRAFRAQLTASRAIVARTEAEWFLDNYYLVAEVAAGLRLDVPPTFFRELPAVASALGVTGLSRPPRCLVVAEAIFARFSGAPSRRTIEEFLATLQERVPLRISELWALPAMIKAVCLRQIVGALEQLMRHEGTEGAAPAAAIAGRGGADASAEVHEPGTVAIAIKTLISLRAIAWREVFAAVSLVHRELGRDPSATYAAMDFETCDRYRKAVERLAKRAGRSELEIAQAAIDIATAGGREDPVSRHVGYYLIDEGRLALERSLGVRVTLGLRLRRLALRYASPVYLAAVLVASCATLLPLALYLRSQGSSLALAALALATAALPASAFAIAWVQWLITHLVKPRRLPRLDASRGAPADCKTLVVIPVLLGDLQEVHSLIQRLESHYLANPDPQLGFALLADFVDAAQRTLPQDELLLARAREGITLLNERHGKQGQGPFHLLLRERLYNPSQGVWMGWERKRGKLEELNRLLAGETRTSYTCHVGAPAQLKEVRFVITLDSDTELPRDAARTLISVLAHPLNQARFDRGRVVAGYTVLQPRIDISPGAANRSRFSRVFASDVGLDIYSRAVSDIYQDLFGVGVYVGKGIYDVDSFRRSQEGKVPENRILSHDLFEGILGRVGLVSDVVLYEDYPPTYVAYARRLHRWIRGDWQLLPWLRLRVPAGKGARIFNPLSRFDRWKVIDNLRRSVTPPALLLLLVSAWTWLPGDPLLWTAGILLLSAGPVLTEVASGKMQLRSVTRWGLSLAFLPHEAVIVADAVIRTLYRMVVSRRRLLEWTTAAHHARGFARLHRRQLVWWEMVAGPSFAVLVVVAVGYARPEAVWAAAPFAALWLLSPELALGCARSRVPPMQAVSEADRQKLRLLARRTWLFFETFVRPEDNWLPPDNVQHQPSVRVAHRTSPTNLGLYLTSCASAHDLGYLGLADLCARVRNTLGAVAKLERHRGQLLNWYETRRLEALTPKYVSTVDNGNLAASLIALRGACTEFATERLFRVEPWHGLRDVFELLQQAVSCMPLGAPQDPALAGALAKIAAILESAEHSPEAWLTRVSELTDLVAELSIGLEAAVRRCGALGKTVNYEVLDWLELLDRQVSLIRASVEPMGAWYSTLCEPPPEAIARFERDETLAREQQQLRRLAAGVTLDGIGALCERVREHAQRSSDAGSPALCRWAKALGEQAALATLEAEAQLDAVLDAARLCDAELASMDFGFLYDPAAHLMSIGYDVSAARSDPNHYDLLASEARLASLVAIALGQVPKEHWVFLGRPVARIERRASLMSWSGTMFEYLMPHLFTRHFEGTLLGSSALAAVERQVHHGRARKTPWGVSESGFALTDSRGDYQYRAFGVPGLGLKRGLEEDNVVAPYASLLALELCPAKVIENIGVFEELGMVSEYGLAEAIDFSPVGLEAVRRRSRGQQGVVVNSHMAHHQGMIMVALSNVLAADSMVSRFHFDPRIRTVSHLLHERIVAPKFGVEYDAHGLPPEKPRMKTDAPQAWHPAREFADALIDPSCHLLSNGSLNLQCDAFGHTSLSRAGISVRPRELGEDLHLAGGFCVYVEVRGQEPRVVAGGRSPGEVTYWPHCVETSTRCGALTVHQVLFVDADADVEVRQLRFVNEGEEAVEVRVTGCGEVALNRAEEHHRHPAFSKMFLETAMREEGAVLLCRRRPRGPNEHFPVVGQALIAESARPVAWETSREEFIGRGRALERPEALDEGNSLQAHAGTVLDPCLAQQVLLRLEPGASEALAWLTAVGRDDHQVIELIEAHRQLAAVPASLERAAHAISQRLSSLGLEVSQVATFQRLASQLIARPRAASATFGGSIRRRLWGHGISGDVPLILFHRRSEEPRLLEAALRARTYLIAQGLSCDLAIVVTEGGGYVDEARERIRAITRSLQLRGAASEFLVIPLASLQAEDRAALEAAAGFVCDSEAADLESELQRHLHRVRQAPAFVPIQLEAPAEPEVGLERPSELLFDNGLGGFRPDGSEYVIFLADGQQRTPAPWCNVLGNPTFGCLVSERGLGTTWAVNAGEFRLTPWSNDPVGDPVAEAVYLRDEETGSSWTATPAPKPAPGAYEVSHGLGLTRYRHRSHQLDQTLTVRVHPHEPVKLVELELHNRTDRARRLTATYFADWVLGTRRPANSPHVVSSFDSDLHALFAQNEWSVEFAEEVAFVASSARIHGFTCDRAEFLGAGGVQSPSALGRWGLSNNDRGAGSCAALQLHLELPPGGTARAHFALGAAGDLERARALAARAITPAFAAELAAAVAAEWSERVGAIKVRTPDPAFDVMINNWALYQACACRLFARTGFYQSSGAFGFRDQLQDVMALALSTPALTREQLIRAAGMQFDAGDVLHWWHPPRGSGVRTRCSDDLLWLPYVATHYVETTGDEAVLDEVVPFLTGDELALDEPDHYAIFQRADAGGTVREHCLRALDRAHSLGPQGLPRMGGGDWNDGLNLVGAGGTGESVWLGWFLYATLRGFARVLRRREDSGAEARDLEARAEALREPLERAWDGQWYRRATFDDGTPLGTAGAAEASIDSIAQSWAVISGAGDPERSARAVRSAVDALVDDEVRLIRLLAPPFHRLDRPRSCEPGYIAGYPPGVRENGAQYTHAAVWLAWAVAELGDRVELERLLGYLNPIRAAESADGARRYRVEPYVLSGDVYSHPDHRGRGGWSWYTGAAAWFWRLGVEEVLGLRVRWPFLELRPKVPASWRRYEFEWSQREWELVVRVTAEPGDHRRLAAATLDGKRLEQPRLDLRTLRGRHELELVLGTEAEAAEDRARRPELR